MVLYYLLSTFYVLTCLILLMVILLQQGKGDMAAAFGGGSSQSAFGARAGATVLRVDALAKCSEYYLGSGSGRARVLVNAQCDTLAGRGWSA